MELKSALFEALALRFELDTEPSAERLARLVKQRAALDEPSYAAFKEMLGVMQRVEASVVAGRPAKVNRTLLADAARMCADVLAACGADASQLGAAAPPARDVLPKSEARQTPEPGESAG